MFPSTPQQKHKFSKNDKIVKEVDRKSEKMNIFEDMVEYSCMILGYFFETTRHCHVYYCYNK